MRAESRKSVQPQHRFAILDLPLPRRTDQHAGVLLIPEAAHQDRIFSPGIENIMHGFIKQDIRMDLLLALSCISRPIQ